MVQPLIRSIWTVVDGRMLDGDAAQFAIALAAWQSPR